MYDIPVANPFARKLSALATLGPSEIAAIVAATARVRTYNARQDLIREGDEPGPVFVLLEGWACRYKILPSGTRQIIDFFI